MHVVQQMPLEVIFKHLAKNELFRLSWGAKNTHGETPFYWAARNNHEDVAELLKRLNSSVFFSDVNLDSTSQVSGHGIKFVSFGLSASVIY